MLFREVCVMHTSFFVSFQSKCNTPIPSDLLQQGVAKDLQNNKLKNF